MAFYSICCGSDCNGAKLNLDFVFDQYGPSVPQLLSRATEAFSRVFQLRGIMRTFAISSAVVFNERARCWDRLERSSQLIHNSQVYLFQPDILDVPSEIPDPIPGADFLIHYQSPQRAYAAHESPRAVAPVSYDARSTFIEESPAYLAPASPTTRERVRQQQLDEMRKHRGEMIDGPSLLREVREEEARKEHLDLDTHRDVVRREAREFSQSLSPDRRQ